MSLYWELCFYMSFGRVVFEVQLLLEAGMEDSLFWLPTNFGNEWDVHVLSVCQSVCCCSPKLVVLFPSLDLVMEE